MNTCFSGYAEICRKTNRLIVSNLFDGIDAYELPSLNRVRSYKFLIKINRPQMVAIANHSQWIVRGGDSGSARVVDASNGLDIAVLSHE